MRLFYLLFAVTIFAACNDVFGQKRIDNEVLPNIKKAVKQYNNHFDEDVVDDLEVKSLCLFPNTTLGIYKYRVKTFHSAPNMVLYKSDTTYVVNIYTFDNIVEELKLFLVKLKVVKLKK